MVEEREALVPPEIDGIRVESELGRGGFAAVWAATLDGRFVAVKVAHRGTEVARARAAREAAALRRLAGAHAPRLVDTGHIRGRPYLILERLGATLEAVLAGGEVFDPCTIAHVARAVAAAHAAGVIHGDLKPDNIVVDGDRARLLDLGSASVDGDRAPVGAGVEYMAPELWRGGLATAASDVYALGAVACELATGQPPFVGDARAVGHQHLMMRPALTGLAPLLAALVRRCLAKDPAQRPTAAALASDLAAIAASLTPSALSSSDAASVAPSGSAATAFSDAATVVPAGRTPATFSGDAAEIARNAALALEPSHRSVASLRGVSIARSASGEGRRATRACVIVIVHARTAAPALAKAVARHQGELVHVRGVCSVVAFGAQVSSPAERALAFAGAVCGGDAEARAAIGLDDVPLDRDGRIAPVRATIEPPWLPPAWRGTIGTARLAALLDRDAPGELVDLDADVPPRDAHPLVGRETALTAASLSGAAWAARTAGRVLIVVGPPGSGRSRLARTIARDAAVAVLSARDPQAASVVDAALGIAGTVYVAAAQHRDGTRHILAVADTHASPNDPTSAAGAATSAQANAVESSDVQATRPTGIAPSASADAARAPATRVSASADAGVVAPPEARPVPASADAAPSQPSELSASADRGLASPRGVARVSASAAATEVSASAEHGVALSEGSAVREVRPTEISAAEGSAVREVDPTEVSAPGVVHVVTAEGSAVRDAVAATGDGRRRVRIVVDDAEDASDALIEALERAAGQGAWIGLTGGPALRGRFARLLDAHEVDAVELGALADDAAAQLLEAALGVERVAEAVVQRLVASGEGRPRQLLAIAAHLRASGAIRTHPGSQRRYLAADAVSPPSGADDAWLGEAALAALAPEVRAVAAACACLAPAFEIGELEVALDHVPNAADPEAALVALVTRGLAGRTGDAWRLTSQPLRRAAALLADRYAIAGSALAYADRAWVDLDERRRRAVAHYATATGDVERAAALYLELAEDNRRAHRDSEAASDYSDALLLLGHSEDKLRAQCRAYIGRGTVRYRSDRGREAVADLDAAARIARGLDDVDLEARARLEAATAHDWLGQYDLSAGELATVELLYASGPPESFGPPGASAPDELDDGTTARPVSYGTHRVTPPADPAIACGLAMARGRTAVRDSRYRDARDALEAALEVEGVHCEDDRLVAKLLLGPTLVQLGELDAAERIYASALADAERLGDTLGRSVAHGNRVLLWAARRDHERALADLAAARDLARRIGHAVPERTTTYNLAEYLYWHGDLAEAARLADASRALQHGLVGEALEDDILIARIAAARGDEATSRAALERASTTRRSCPTAIALLRDATLAYLDRDTRRLDGLAGAARDALVGEELTEVLAWRASARRAVGEPAGNPSDPGLQAWRFL